MRKLLKIIMLLVVAVSGALQMSADGAWASGKTYNNITDVTRAYDDIVRLEREGFAAGKSITEVRALPAYQAAARKFDSYSYALGAEGRRQFEQARNVGVQNVNAAMASGQPVTGVQALQNVQIQGVARRNTDDDFRSDEIAGTQQEMASIIRMIATVTVAIATGVGIAQQAPNPVSR